MKLYVIQATKAILLVFVIVAVYYLALNKGLEDGRAEGKTECLVSFLG